jgi:Na+-translocating ferredoxin:NAD+ oxidoreductase subunit B
MASFAVMGGLGLLLGLLLAFASDLLYVEMDTRYDTIMELLPQVNCGACGFPGCAGFTNGILEGKVNTLGLCKPGSKGEGLVDLREYLKNTPGPDGNVIDLPVK